MHFANQLCSWEWGIDHIVPGQGGKGHSHNDVRGTLKHVEYSKFTHLRNNYIWSLESLNHKNNDVMSMKPW